MEYEPKSRPGVFNRLKGWRERRRQAARKRRALTEDRISKERYNYRGQGAAASHRANETQARARLELCPRRFGCGINSVAAIGRRSNRVTAAA
jgi:hypothetical protein